MVLWKYRLMHWWHPASVFGITARLRAGRPEFGTPTGEMYFPPKRPFSLWNPLRTLFNVCGSSCLEVKRSECDVDHTRPSDTELKNEWSCKYTPPIRLYVVDRDKFQCFTLHLKHRHLRALMSGVVNSIGPRKIIQISWYCPLSNATYLLVWAGKAGRSGDRIPVGGEIFCTCPDRSWGPPSLLYKGYRGFLGGKSGRGVKLTPHPPSIAVVMKG